jgi:3-oxoacyl-[acyl-carrier-protein] synthase III
MFVHTPDVDAGRNMVLRVADQAHEAIGIALRRAAMDPKDISHFYAHQPTAFFPASCRLAGGLGHTQTTDTFKEYASMGSANVAVNLWKAATDGQLAPGATVVLYAIGPGMNWTASVLKWSAAAN